MVSKPIKSKFMLLSVAVFESERGTTLTRRSVSDKSSSSTTPVLVY